MDLENLLGHRISAFGENLIIAAGAIILGMLLNYIVRKIFMVVSKMWLTFLINSILKNLQGPMNVFLPLLFLSVSFNFMTLNAKYYVWLEKILSIALTVLVALILIRIIKILEEYFYHKYDLKKADNLRERKITTQLQFIRKFTVALIVLVTAAVVLLSFESMQKIGAGLLTGVGIGGIIIGFAAQKSLGNLLAGFQIAFTQPIRIDDVLVVEGEWGRVEEITLTYVVINIWDQRRLILPITYFIEKPFQNWTRVSSQLLGTVFLYLDYTIPIPPLREELTRLLVTHRLWDKRVNVVQVTDNKPDSIEVRLLMSANTSGEAFDLRCDVREMMIAFILKNYPECLPRTRLEYRSTLEDNLSRSGNGLEK
ncbi:mechanosensitive ion channel family protein [Pedobacter metabolipauper]|uniref:Small-conductance mechanosensitive channel n=1 Tax=Pedobacter metabolipauper TaxID=425513 RepID=A0A4R6SY24_9SPHI|nr:mechanosensitive ion channel domain-containing protein [Pedobacter metabolipauper]TDQ11444.1 small-conductance mechanosensitive channel [Pedobacter metabolipauper]